MEDSINIILFAGNCSENVVFLNQLLSNNIPHHEINTELSKFINSPSASVKILWIWKCNNVLVHVDKERVMNEK